MEFIQSYWGFIPLIVLFVIGIIKFINLPTEEQAEQVRRWLLWAVTQAEMELGSGTHKLKLSMVYDMFVKRFPWLAKTFTYERFARLVDKALDEMNNMIVTNEKVKVIVCGER